MRISLDGDTIYRGDGKKVSATICADDGSLVDAQVRFLLAKGFEAGDSLVTLSRTGGDMTIDLETDYELTVTFQIPASATLGMSNDEAELIWEVEVTPDAGVPFTRQGQVRMLPAIQV